MLNEGMDPDDELDPEHVDCRLCGGEDLLPGQRHECLYANNEAMSEEDEATCLAMLNATAIDRWHPSSPWATDDHQIDGWTVRVFFDGVDADDLDYIECVTTPAGVTYTSWPKADERALPMSITNWRPAKMGPIEDVINALRRIAERFREMVNNR